MHRVVLAVALLVSGSGVLGCGDDGGPADPDAADHDAAGGDAGPSCGAGIEPEPGLAVTALGAVRGAHDDATDTYAYLGVPFAAPPVGALRFQPPTAPACWDGELDARAIAPACPQLDEDGVDYHGDEDCLYLNVWAPAAASAAAPRPVMVFIHGGGNAIGETANPIYDGARLAAGGDAVVVTTAYRVGALGYLTHPALAAEQGGASGNYGTRDLVAALAWVRDHIAPFGGDPARVTIFGESAGGRNVCTLLAVPDAAGLFDRAIVESGACKFLDDVDAAEATGATVAANAGCGDAGDAAAIAACLRDLSAEEVVRALPVDVSALASAPFGSHVDGAFLPEMPEAAIAAGHHAAVPFIIGANADETAASVPPLSAQAYEDLVVATYGPTLGALVLDEYPASDFATPRLAYVAVSSDARFICPSREIARAARAGQDEPVHRYFFAYAPTPIGAVHGLELVYLFATFDAVVGAGGEPYEPTAADLALSDAMIGYWSRFAASGSPDGDGAPAWPTYADGDDPTLVLDDPITSTDGVRTDHCDFWQPFYDAL